MRKSFLIALVAAIAVAPAFAPMSKAAVPSQMTVQGLLTNPSGVPAPIGPKTFIFRIFDASVGGLQVWPAIGGEIQSVNTDANGLWTARVGLVSPLSDDFFSGAERWLEITVDDGINPPETLTRMKINSNAFAYRIGTVDGAEGGRITSKVTIGANSNMGTDGFVAGLGNIVNGEYSVIPGGSSNQAHGDYITIGGGEQNRAMGSTYATIGGGLSNSITGGSSNVVAGGYRNRVETASDAAIGGGTNNDALADGSLISGGSWNKATNSYAVVGGGGGPTAPDGNRAGADYSVIGGGRSNVTTGNGAVVGGGLQNDSRRFCATIAGGFLDTASGDFATIGGGLYNATWEYAAVVSGGQNNNAAAQYATVPGGRGNYAYGVYSFAAGHRAQADDGAFVWADSTNADFPAAGDPSLPGPFNAQFLARATGGATIVTAVDASGYALSGVTVPAGSGSWSTLSDRESKSDLSEVNPEDILAKVAALPIAEWRYKTQDESIRHIGPMAQDFHDAFGLGEDVRRISTVDADGVALASIKALYDLVERQSEELRELRQEIAELRASKQQ